jgi:predicted RNA-binding Zn-ribbon protein involved in translation (DUF1610 family)
MIPQMPKPISSALSVKCCGCGAAIPLRQITMHSPFNCPECGTELQIRGSYLRVQSWATIVLVTFAAYAAGWRGDELFSIVLVSMWPALVIVGFVTLLFFPPDVESTGEFRDILYGFRSPKEAAALPDRSIRAMSPADASAEAPAGAGQRRMFVLGAENRTFEGIVLRGAAVALGIGIAWMIVRPFVHYVAPEWGATKQGPPAFPVKVHIGGETIAFTNGSTVFWTCEASPGLSKQRFSFSIDPHGTRELSYVHFRGSGSQTEVGVLRDAARGLIDITCAEPSGRTHLWQFD